MCRGFQGSAIKPAYLVHHGPRGQRLSTAGEGALCSNNNPEIPGWLGERERNWNIIL